MSDWDHVSHQQVQALEGDSLLKKFGGLSSILDHHFPNRSRFFSSFFLRMREEHACSLVVDGAYWSKYEKQHDLDITSALQYIQQELGAEVQQRFWLDSQLKEARRNSLQSATGPRFVVKEYPAKTWECPVCHCQSTVQAGCDIGIAFRIFHLAKEYRRIVVLAGDGDFEEALAYAREVAGCEIYLVTFKDSSSTKLHP